MLEIATAGLGNEPAVSAKLTLPVATVCDFEFVGCTCALIAVASPYGSDTPTHDPALPVTSSHTALPLNGSIMVAPMATVLGSGVMVTWIGLDWLAAFFTSPP